MNNREVLDSIGRLKPGKQRVVSRREIETRRRIARLHERIANQRKHIAHQVANELLRDCDVLVLEKLNVSSMTRSAKGTAEEPGTGVRAKASLNREILDRGWSQLATILRYKANEIGVKVIEVPAAYSSQTCGECGHVDADSRHAKSFACTDCGHRDDADVNAARVLAQRGTAELSR